MINIDVGYEMWKKGYSFRGSMFEGEKNCYDWLVANPTKTLDDYIIEFPDRVYNEAEEAEKYRRENEPKLKAYYDKYIANRSFEDIEEGRWDFYSDWHKDVYGYRPHWFRNSSIAPNCGEYVNPYFN